MTRSAARGKWLSRIDLFYAINHSVFKGYIEGIYKLLSTWRRKHLPRHGEAPDRACPRCFKGRGAGIQCGTGGADIIYKQYLLALQRLVAGKGTLYVTATLCGAPGPGLRQSVFYTNQGIVLHRQASEFTQFLRQ